jgi:4-hydroxy-tetrahydrodipicolinate synthase
MLTPLVLIPLLGALLLLLLPAALQPGRLRTAAIATLMLLLGWTLLVCLRFDPSSAAMQLQECHPWLPSIGLEYRLGIDGLMVLPAMVYKSDPRETLAHFRAVARASGLPVMIYNNPPAYSTDDTPEMFVELADEPTIVSIKESSSDPRRITDLVNLTGDRYILFSGVDDLVMECALLGAVGWISGLVNAFPAENRALWDLIIAGKWAEALALYRWYTPLLHLDTHVKLVQYIKLAAQETGLCSETTRPPRLAIEGPEREKVLGIIRKAIATRPAL